MVSFKRWLGWAETTLLPNKQAMGIGTLYVRVHVLSQH